MQLIARKQLSCNIARLLGSIDNRNNFCLKIVWPGKNLAGVELEMSLEKVLSIISIENINQIFHFHRTLWTNLWIYYKLVRKTKTKRCLRVYEYYGNILWEWSDWVYQYEIVRFWDIQGIYHNLAQNAFFTIWRKRNEKVWMRTIVKTITK